MSLLSVQVGALVKSVVDDINKFSNIGLYVYLTKHHDLKLYNTYRVSFTEYETTNRESDVQFLHFMFLDRLLIHIGRTFYYKDKY